MPKLSEDKYKKIIRDYLEGKTQEVVANENGITRNSVSKILTRNNVLVRKYTGNRSDLLRKWKFNTDFFFERTPITAYWAGFAMADGSISKVSKGSYEFTLCLQKKDIEHIRSFCSHINLPFESVHIRKNGDPDVRLHHPSLLEQLSPWGIIPRKTYNYVEPKVPDNLLSYYLLGWADGDGLVYSTGTDSRFVIYGRLDALEWYSNQLLKLGYSGNVSVKSRDSDWHGYLYVGGVNQVQEIRTILNVDNSFKLDRKWNSYRNQKRKLISVVCKQCGKSFGVAKYRYNHPTQGNWCSLKCYRDSL